MNKAALFRRQNGIEMTDGVGGLISAPQSGLILQMNYGSNMSRKSLNRAFFVSVSCKVYLVYKSKSTKCIMLILNKKYICLHK